jgi:uncharacterized protein
MMNNQQSYKFIITGTFNSGKTSFIQAISENGVVSVEGVINTRIYSTIVALDSGKIETQGTAFEFFATPDSVHFSLTWELLAEKAALNLLGFIIMVDSSTPEHFRRTREIIAGFGSYIPCPFVIAANKQDKPYAWDVEALRIALRIPDEIPIIPCNAHDKKSVANVLIALCEEILKSIDASEAES